MPTIVTRFDESSQDTRFKRIVTTLGSTTAFTGFEYEAGTPFSTGFPIGGTESSGGTTENKALLRFQNIAILRGSKIESAEITLFAKVLNAQFGNPPMQINISANTDSITNTTSQTQLTYTSLFTKPVRDPKGTFTLTTGETSYVEKTANVTELVQELVNQFEYTKNDDMRFRMTNKSFIDTVLANPYPRTGGGGVDTAIQAQIYALEQGLVQKGKLTIIYSSPCTDTLCDDFTYNKDSFTSRGLSDPAIFGNQSIADTSYISSDLARIRINSPFPPADQANRLDLSCPNAVAHNAECHGENSPNGTFGGGAIDDESWNYRFKIDITAFTLNTDPTGQEIHIGLSNNNALSDGAQDYIGLKIGTAGSVSSFDLVATNGGAPTTGGAIEGTFTTLPSTGVFFVELVRKGKSGGFTQISCALFNDKDYSDLIERVEGIAPIGITGLDRLKFMVKNVDGTGNGNIVVEYGQRDNLQVVSATGRPTLFGGFLGSITATGHAVAREPSVELETFEDDFKLPANFEDLFTFDQWQDTGVGFGVNAGTDELDWTANNSATNNATSNNLIGDINVSPFTWTLRFKLDIDSLATGTSAVENRVFLGMCDQGAGVPASTNQLSIGLGIGVDNTTSRFFTTHSRGIVPIFSNPTNFTTAIPSVGTVFVEIIRNSGTSMTVNIYSDETFKTLIESVSDNTLVAGTIPALLTPKLQSRDDGVGADSTLNGSIDNFQLFSSIAPVTTNWTNTGTNVVDNPTGQEFAGEIKGVIDIDATKDGTLHQTATDLKVVSDNKWTLRFDMEILTSTTPTTNDATILVNISDSDQTVGVLSAQDTITFEYNSQGDTGVKRFLLRWADGVGILPGTGFNFFLTSGANDVGDGKFYVEIKRVSATIAEINIYSDSDFTNLVFASGQTVIPATINGLRFIRVSTRDDVTSAGILTSRIGKIQFWDGQDELEHNNNWKVSN